MISETIAISAPRARVFHAYVEEINGWWPREGTYRYSFAPPHTRPASIHLEPAVGGRFYERYEDGSEYVIGRVTAYEPPHFLSYTWKAPEWSQDTSVEVQFTETPTGTVVTVSHRGLPKTAAAGYATGLAEILQAFMNRVEMTS